MWQMLQYPSCLGSAPLFFAQFISPSMPFSGKLHGIRSDKAGVLPFQA
jgi:hypothetical protein